MIPIAVFYHGLFTHGTPREVYPGAFEIVRQAMHLMQISGLTDAAQEIHACFNGPPEDEDYAKLVVPPKASILMHGPDSFAENLTIIEIEKWVKTHPGWLVLYFHAKGATHPQGDAYGDGVSKPWRETMLNDLVMNWRRCVSDLANYESVGCHFMKGLCDGTQNIWAGNFWWARSDFLATLPTMYLRDRIKVSGISAAESRYESEVWIGNGRLPSVMEYRPGGGGGVP